MKIFLRCNSNFTYQHHGNALFFPGIFEKFAKFMCTYYKDCELLVLRGVILRVLQGEGQFYRV